jgi:hypothetical protein
MNNLKGKVYQIRTEAKARFAVTTGRLGLGG